MRRLADRFPAAKQLQIDKDDTAELLVTIQPYLDWQLLALDDGVLLGKPGTRISKARREDLVILTGKAARTWIRERCNRNDMHPGRS